MAKKIRIQAQVQYELDKLLGVGGGGEVYSAWRFADESSPKQKVALKIVKASLDSEQLAQLHNEAQIISGINSAHIVQVLGIEKIAEQEFALVMELVEGVTLASWLKNIPAPERHPLFWRLALHLITGLSELHSRQITHGDLSPRNALVSTGGVAKIVDFGLSTLRSTQGAGLARGTPGYLSPRRLNGERALQQDDLFAVGCILYECLFGEKLFLNPKALHSSEIEVLLSKNKNLQTQGSAETQFIRRLLSQDQDQLPLTAALIKDLSTRFPQFLPLPVFFSENTETLLLPPPLIARRKNSSIKKLIAVGVAFFICTSPSLTKTSVAIPEKLVGSVVLNAKPWAYVYIDGHSMGETPLLIPKLRAGWHRADFVGGEQKKTIWFEVYPKTSARITHIF